MPVTHIRIENFKSIKRCDIDLDNITALIGANGTGKTNILDAINYFYNNLTESNLSDDVFDANNKYSNQVAITITFDLENFIMISKTKQDDLSGLFGEYETTSEYNHYFRSIHSLVSSKKGTSISLRLSQIKGKGVCWNEPYEKRLIIKSLFPFFYIDVRNLDIQQWSKIWSIFGELSKTSNSERKAIEQQIKTIVDGNKEMSSKIKAINDIFVSSELSVMPEKSKSFASLLSKIYFSGETITQKGRDLQFFSSGTNSVKYIEILLRGINEIARNKMKEPVILIDEPEISLHPNYVDELAEAIMVVDNRLKVVVSTHSSRLIKALSTLNNMGLYNIKLNNHYTSTIRMKKYQQYSPESKYRVLDDHINSYFSRAILFVEGETELELFSNPYLKILFPCLKSIDVFQAMSQVPIMNIMHPKKTNSKTPYICLIDADKTFSFDQAKRCFILKNEYFKNPKERFSFRNKKEKSKYLHHLHIRINAMIERLKVHYYMPFYSCNDPNLNDLRDAIHQYLLCYGVYSLETTIEGVLVNKHSKMFALDFLKQKANPKDFDQFAQLLGTYKDTDQINIIRLLFNGKTDLLMTYRSLRKSLGTSISDLLEKVMIGKKTSGWVSEYLDCFFSELMPPEMEKSPRTLKKLFDEHPDEKEKYLKCFESHFPELTDLLSKIHIISE